MYSLCFVPNFIYKSKYSLARLIGLLLLSHGISCCAQVRLDQRIIIPSNSNRKIIQSSSRMALVDSPYCIDNSDRILLHEDSTIVTAKFIAVTRDGNFLIPGYCYPNAGVYYKTPYLIKCTPKGDILWSKSYPSRGIYPSSWFIASRIKELRNGDLLMVGEIGVPGTDDRRELAVWRLDKNGKQIWSESYESSLWTNPITGSSEVTGIQEDLPGNIFLSGNLRIFESSRFTFLMKMTSNGTVLWDKSYSINNPLVFGFLLYQNKLQLIGTSGPFSLSPGVESNLLWCASINSENGDIIHTKAWYADFDQQSFA